MSERPPDLHLDDLAEPEFSPEARAVVEGAGALAPQITLALAPLMEQAAAETGLDDFGDDAFREPFGLLLECLEKEAELSPMGRVSSAMQILGHLKNRLLLEDLVRRHPEIETLAIDRPIVIAGLPRTGTTHLHNLISADPALRSLPYWESLEPVPPLEEQERSFEVDPRFERCKATLGIQVLTLPHFNRMHDMYPEHVHEEVQLSCIAGSSMLFECMAPMPTWREYYLSTDQTPFYRYLKRVLQTLQFLRGGTRWILKSPQHLEQFGPLRSTFPDATFAVTHRDPVSITASFATMITYSARLSRDPVEPHVLGRYWSDRIERMLRACVEQRDLLPAEQSIDIRFHEFMADDVATVERIYALAGQPFTPDVRAAMDAFMREHPRGKHGRILYDLADFGLDRAERRRALQFYVDRFGLDTEGE